MPYKSLAQEGLFHSADSPVGPEEVKHWDAATKGKHLPQKLKDGGIVGDKSKVSDKWGVDLTKWANESEADKMDDRVRNEGNVEAKMQLEKQRQAMVDAGSPPASPPVAPKEMKHGGKVPGKGSGDHVAALLEPGELVVPKKDAEKMFKPSNTWTHDDDEDGE